METTGKANYKIRVNIPCQLYIDDELRQDLEANKMVKLSLDPGPYLRKVVAVDNPSLQDEKEIEIPADTTLLDNIKLGEVADSVSATVVANPPVNAVPVVQEVMKKYDIFISYRKDSSSQRVDKLYHYLNGKYPDKVFRDIKQLAVGDWLTQIVQYVDTCKMLVVVLDRDTFKDRDISNDTKERYERWATLSREELHAEIEGMPLEEKNKVNYIRIEILRAKAHDAIIFPIKCNIGELSEDLKNALYCKEQFEVSPAVTDDEWLTLVKAKWESSVVSELYAVQYSKQGKDILATDIYYDSNRAKEKFGFDETFYIPRKVDDELSMYVENPKTPFCFITGLPGSGKTRAIYQLCHGALKNQSVIILTKSNVNTIADLLSSNTRKIDSQYIICDQIIDVLFVLDEEKRKTFIDKLCDSNYYHLIGSNTKARLDDFLIEYSECLIGYKLIEIPIIDKSIINRLINHLEAQGKEIKVENGKTIADLIPGINEYKKAILNSLLKKTVKNEKKYLELLHDWLKSLQLVMTFRKEYRLFLAILVFKQLSERRDAQFDINWLRTCIQAMIGLNMLYLQDNNKSISKNDIGQKFIKITTANFEYDGEYFLDIMGKYIDKSESKNCIFEVNELIWQYLLDKTDTFKSEQFKEVLYDFSDEDDLQEAIEIYYAAFPTLSSLRRIIPRIPDGSVQAAANAKVIKILEEKYIIDEVIDNEENLAEIQYIYSLIIGRCTCNEEVEAYLTQLIDKKIISQGNYPGSIIGELYRYAENSMDIYSRNYIEYVENIRKKRYYIQISDFKIDLQADCQTNLKGDDLYAIEKEINALLRLKKIKLDFESLKSYLSKCFDRLRLKEKNILNDDKLLVNINRLLNLLVRYSHVDNGNIEAISELLRTYNLLDQESGIYPIYTIFKYLAKYTNGSPEKCRCIIDQLIYRDARSCADIGWNLSLASQKVKEFFGQFIVSAIAQADTFAEAVQLYELYAKGFEKESVTEFTEEHADKYKILSMAMRKCTATEFQTMVAYLEPILKNLRTQLLNSKQQNKQLDIWYINYTIKVLTNLLMEKSPSQTDAMYYLEQLDAEQVDSYALCHILKKVKKNANRQEQFIWAYSVINHPKLEKFRSEVQILNLLFRLTNDIEQEKLIDEIAGEKKKTNAIYLSIKLGKEFRSLSEKTDLYKQFYANDNEGEENALRRVDLFSTASKELWKAKKRYDTLTKEYEEFSGLNPDVKGLKEKEIKVLHDDITKVEKFLKKESKKDFRDNDSDPYYTLALIQLGELNVFDDKNEITVEFTESHLSRFVTIKHWNSLINLFRNENDKDAEIKIKELCKLYKEKYDGTKRSYLLRPDDMMRRCLNKVGVNLDEDNIEESEILASEYAEGEEVLFETSEPETGEDYVDDNELIFSKDESGHVYLNEHFDKIKQCDDAKNVIWWTKKINWAKKHKEEEEIRCIYNSYLDFLKEYNSVTSLHPDWMMYKYSYDKPLDECIRDLFDSKKHIMRELETPTIIPSRLADVFEHVCKLQKEKKEIPTIVEIISIIEKNDLWRMIDIDHKSFVSLYLFIIRQGSDGKKYLLEYKDKFENINNFTNSNMKSLGELSREKIVMTNNLLRHSFYFYKWLKVYLDIYKNEEEFCKHYADDSTIKIHIQRHFEFDCFFEDYVKSIDQDKSLQEVLKKKIEPKGNKETLIKMLECYKNYTIENLNCVYEELDENLRTKGQLITLDNNASIDIIVESLDRYATLKDDIARYYESKNDYKYLKRAAVLGSVQAQYKYGKDNKVDYMIISAAKHGYEDALGYLRSKFAENLKKCKNAKEINNLYSDFVNQVGELHKNDLSELGQAYFRHGMVAQFVKNCHHLASEKGHAQTAHFLYEMYKNGRWVRVDQYKAWYYLKLSVLNNTNPEDTKDKETFVQWSLGIINRPENTSLETIIGTYNGLIEVGYELTREDYYKLGNVLKGFNDARCLDHFKTAAELGHATAAYDLWKMYESGTIVEKSIEQARHWMNRAAELNNPFAQNAVVMHEKVMAQFNEGVALYPINKEKGIAIFRKLANDGLADAQHRMGVNYYNIALGTNYDVDKRKNFERAYPYFLLAANQGFAVSQYQVAVCLEQGRGIEKDLVEAKRWFQFAANQGHQNAIAKLQNLM